MAVWLRRAMGVALLIAMAGAARGQERAPFRFRAEVNVLLVDVIVTDDDGRFVDDLRVDEFELFDNGERREISTFALVALPGSNDTQAVSRGRRDSPSTPDEGIATNAGVDSGRVFVLVLDDLHVDAQRSARVREVVKEFIASAVRPGDLISIGLTSGHARAFGASRQAVDATIDGFIGQRLRSATLERLDGQSESNTVGARDLVDMYVTSPAERQRGQRNLTALRFLRAQCELLEAVPGRRKAVLWFSEGLDYDIESPGGRHYTEGIRAELLALQDRAARANVAIYTVNPRGLNAIGDDQIHVASGSRVATAGVNSSIYAPGAAFAPEDPSLGTASMLNDRATAIRGLRRLAEATGGVSMAQRNDLGKALESIVEDTSRYYLLGFTPKSDGEQDELQRLEVRVTRDSLSVRARQGYVAAPSATSRPSGSWGASADAPELGRALAQPVPTEGLSLRVAAAPMGQDGERALVPVVVTSGVDRFQFEERDGRFHDDVELWIGAFDARGRLADSHTSRVNLAVPAALRSALVRDGFRAAGRLELEPGYYQLRVGVHETGAGRTGSVLTDLDIPSPGDGLLRGLALSSVNEGRIPVAGFERDETSTPLPFVTGREFDRSDQLTAYLEITNPGREAFELEMEVVTSGGERAAYFRAEAPVSQDGSVTLVSRGVPLEALAPGNYELSFRALAADGDERSLRRMAFTIR